MKLIQVICLTLLLVTGLTPPVKAAIISRPDLQYNIVEFAPWVIERLPTQDKYPGHQKFQVGVPAHGRCIFTRFGQDVRYDGDRIVGAVLYVTGEYYHTGVRPVIRRRFDLQIDVTGLNYVNAIADRPDAGDGIWEVAVGLVEEEILNQYPRFPSKDSIIGNNPGWERGHLRSDEFDNSMRREKAAVSFAARTGGVGGFSYLDPENSQNDIHCNWR